MIDFRSPSLSVDPDAAFESVAHDQLGGAFQVPTELVRLAIAFGAVRVEVQCRRGRVIVTAEGAVIPESALKALIIATGHGDEVTRLRALATLEDVNASALSWSFGLEPRSLEIRSWDRGSESLLCSRGPQSFRFSQTTSRHEDGVSIKLTRPRLNFKRARGWLEIACRFSPVPVILNGHNLQRELESGCFRARITTPVPTVIALGVDLPAPRLWLLRHGVVSARIGIPDWPPFEAAVEMEGLVTGSASNSHLRKTMASHLDELIRRVAALTLRIVPRLPQIDLDHRRRISLSLLKTAGKRIEVEAIRQARLFELVEVGGSRWLSLHDLQRWRGGLPLVCDQPHPDGAARLPYLILEPREREMVTGLIARPLANAAVSRLGFSASVSAAVSSVGAFIRGLAGPRTVAINSRKPGEIALIQSLEGALVDKDRAISVVLTRGRRRPRRWGRHLVLAQEQADTQRAIWAIARDPRAVYPVALALKAPHWRVRPDIRSAWLDIDDLV